MTANQLIQKLQTELLKVNGGEVPIKIDGIKIPDLEVKINEDESGLFMDIQQIYF